MSQKDHSEPQGDERSVGQADTLLSSTALKTKVSLAGKPPALSVDSTQELLLHTHKNLSKYPQSERCSPRLPLSQVDFEAAAQSVMVETLREVKRLRPKALWGVSPYPACYGGEPSQTTLANSSGQCPAAEMALNDELLWLWRRCSALYPLLTLEKVQVGHAASRSPFSR